MNPAAPDSFIERFKGLLEPSALMWWAATHYYRVCSEAVFQKGQVLAPIFQTSKLRDEAFGRFWIEFSRPREEAAEPVGSSALIPPLLKTSKGVVLDIGPGTGTQMPLLKGSAITTIYGAEPCTGLHSELRRKAASEGLGSKYHVLPCGVAAEELLPALGTDSPSALAAYDVDPAAGVFDTILCVRVLCSVPAMEKTTRELYSLLKPGGRLLVVEHVVNPWRTAKGSFAARVAQAVYMFLGWRFYIGDCCLDRDTEGALRQAAAVDGGWESVELERHFEWSAMPYISGVLTKKSL
ncbi:hypothetical protein N7468_008003 [Penicillium chermesinum]|uniref:Uncharacterized protein n=1 Tax=Penicillium chermesinum TaxID=63820 RepID=A0A9W9THZ1_9EURO|nr:uncharacterized protein N7468_008003 [Penicillium chermesinum]KAJ5223461.1 hypothetical protein N7468_008003 [Penicillium chermesinum]KAJ6155706.1 hypothetical protein N7470_006272 [Penicillium chermesinum]